MNRARSGEVAGVGLDRTERSLRGRIGAFRLHATHDSRQTSAPGRAAFLASFERLVDPHGTLPAAERARRAAHARSAHFARLAYLSARARRARARRRPTGGRLG